MTGYTPPTGLVRTRYIGCVQLLDPEMRNVDDSFDFTESDTKLGAEFDRWFAPYEAALAAVQRVRELHWEFKDSEMRESWCNHSGNTYPCPTIKALDR